MNQDHEASYYEIALTNRQVLTIFIVLLTCLVAAFLSGVWVGRDSGGETVAALEAPVAETEASQLAELNFFSDARPLDGAQRSAAPVPPSGKPPAASRPPVAEPSASGPAATADPPVAAPPAAPPAAPAPAPPATATQGAAPGAAAKPVIQVFSSADAGQARRLVERLGAGGYPAYLLEESLQGQKMYRVRVGPYGEETEAQRVADKLRREFRLDTWITSQPG